MHHVAQYAPNGLDLERFPANKRTFEGKKIRILVEGDCGVEYKNVDESFKIIDQLDLDKFEIWYLSYNAKPKSYYKVDKFFNKIPYEEVGKIYAQCDILLKTKLFGKFFISPTGNDGYRRILCSSS